MSFLKKLFGQKQTQEAVQEQPTAPVLQGEVPTAVKANYKVYPRIKNAEAHNLEVVYHEPLGGDLVLTFVQDIDDRIVYVLKSEAEQLMPLIEKWKDNIAEVPYELFTTDDWGDSICFNQPDDYSNEKVFDNHFIDAACTQLKTDKLIISISRRYRMQLTSYYNEFKDLELFFYKHFDTWSTTDLNDETITEYVLIAEKGKGVTDIVHMGFRIRVYTKDGKYLMNYSTYGDDVISDKIDFAEVIEKRKEAFYQ